MSAAPTGAPAPALPDGVLAVGLDVGGTKTHGVLYGSRGAVSSLTLPTTPGVEGVVATAGSVVSGLLAEAAAAHGRLGVVGIGIPGVVDSTAGTVSNGVNVGLDVPEVPLARLVGEALGVPVVVVNDVTAATFGAARAMGVDEDAALLSIGTGLAAGLILGGAAHVGTHGIAGEIGHIPYRADGPVCACGQRGCLELYASGRALARMRPTPGGTPPAVALFAAVDRGDPGARRVHAEWMGALAHAVTVLCLTVDVGTVLLTGGVTRTGDRFLADLRAELGRQAARSAFLRRADLASRLALVDPDLRVAPLGACLSALGVLGR